MEQMTEYIAQMFIRITLSKSYLFLPDIYSAIILPYHLPTIALNNLTIHAMIYLSIILPVT